jgi:DNA-binding Lrp family transcriptional regulator
MDDLDYRLLDVLQNEFPLAPRPYEVIAERLQLSADEVWQRVQAMKEGGIIRRLGASLDSRKLGYTSTLVGVSVPPDSLGQASEVICGFAEVTHCYQRKNAFNIWFTLIARDEDRVEEILAHIKVRLSLEDAQVLNVPVQRLFKLDARFDASVRQGPEEGGPDTQ